MDGTGGDNEVLEEGFADVVGVRSSSIAQGRTVGNNKEGPLVDDEAVDKLGKEDEQAVEVKSEASEHSIQDDSGQQSGEPTVEGDLEGESGEGVELIFEDSSEEPTRDGAEESVEADRQIPEELRTMSYHFQHSRVTKEKRDPVV